MEHPGIETKKLTFAIKHDEIFERVTRFLGELGKIRNGRNLPQPLKITLPCEEVEIIEWLQSCSQAPRIYWEGRDQDEEFGGAGAVYVISESDPEKIEGKYDLLQEILRISPAGQSLIFFGGSSFNCDPGEESDWSGFPRMWFVLPEILLQRSGNRFQISVTVLVDGDQNADDLTRTVVDKFEQIECTFSNPERPALPRLVERIDRPAYPGWRANVRHALDLIQANRIQKVVLARKTSLKFTGQVNWITLLPVLRERNKNCFIFLFQPGDNGVFLGATPERLFKIDRQVLISEAVSGTGFRRDSGQQDLAAGADLLRSEKNLREHQFVTEAIKTIFSSLCRESGFQPRPTLLQLSNVQHLYTRVVGNLKENTTLYRVISELHPTPAVGGTPRARAVRLIHELESFDRRWYAGPVGFISRENTEMVVALRSMLIKRDRVHLFAGAGIVAGSEPELEWQELESKISIAMNILENRPI